MTDQEMVAQFESLGDNCEFGLFQRSIGIEPAGFFRFNFADLAATLRLLNNDFADVATPSSIELYTEPNEKIAEADREVMVRVPNYGLRYHTFKRCGDIDPAQLIAQQSKVLRFLGDKFLADLRAAEKIFVRRGDHTATQADMLGLLQAMRRHGPNATLLWVTIQDNQHVSGTAEIAAPGLIRGYMDNVDHFSPNAAQDGAAWLQLCRTVMKLSRQQSPVGTLMLPEKPLPQPNLIPSAMTFAGPHWWNAAHAINRLSANITPHRLGYAVREHMLLQPTGYHNSGIQGFYAQQGLAGGAIYCASIWVWLPQDFAGLEVGVVFAGFPSIKVVNADLSHKQGWQRVWATARIPPDNLVANPTLTLLGPGGTRIYSTNWRLELGTAPSEPNDTQSTKMAAPTISNAKPARTILTRIAGFFRQVPSAPAPPIAPPPPPPTPIFTPPTQPRQTTARHATPTKWYFAVDRATLAQNFDQVQGAVLSARTHTRLRPICLLDDTEDLSQVTTQISWLERNGVSLMLHSAHLFTIVQNRLTDAKPFSAQWLRCDIPILDSSDEYVLYTDPNIIFRKPVDLTQFEPPVFACAPDKTQNLLKHFDSSVMLINLPAMRATRAKLIDQLQRRLPTMLERNDLYTLNDTYKNDWITLPSAYNWKPYWGFNPDAAIVHFHGPTPDTLRKMFAGEIHFYANDDIEFLRRNPEAYKKYLDEFNQLPITRRTAAATPALKLYQPIAFEALQPSQNATIDRRIILPAANYPLPPLAYGDLTHHEPEAVHHAPVEAFTITNAVIHGGLGIVSVGDQIAAKTLDHMPWHNLPFAARQTAQGLEFPAVPDEPTLPAVYHLMACNQDNYYHWLIDVTLRYLPEVMADFAQSANGQAVILHPPITTDWKRECLDLLLPEEIPKIALTLAQTLKAKRLIYVPELSAASDNPHPALLQTSDLMRNKALGGQPLPSPTRKIFVSRADSQNRVLTNEAELSNMARQAGFETIILTGMKVADQIKLFAEASHIIAPHGAALTNILFCQPGAKLLELLMDTYLHRAFHRLAALRGVIYGRLIGQSTPIEGVGLFGHTWHLEPQKLAELLSDPRFLERPITSPAAGAR